MAALPKQMCDPYIRGALTFLEEALATISPRAFAVRLWDGTILMPTPGQPAHFTLAIQHPGALRRMFWSPNERSLGEAFLREDFDIEGDVEQALSVGDELMRRMRDWGDRLRLRLRLMRLPLGGCPRGEQRAARLQGRVHSQDRDMRAIRYHYDVSNDFYALFLDERMVYSCARFDQPGETLDSAQKRKLEHICRSLRLQPGDRLLDIGCGWGGLLLYAAQNFGVRGLGVTLSQRQAEWARERIRRAGMEGRCRVEVRDYRDVDAAGSFDKITSIGMVEHVGARQLPGYFAQVARLLKQGGDFFLSGISRPVNEPARTPHSFIGAYVFPDGELEPIHEMLGAAENTGFAVRWTENLREQYGLTLRHWVHRLERNAEEACRITDRLTYRVWRLYMAGSAARFFSGRLHLYQTLLSKVD